MQDRCNVYTQTLRISFIVAPQQPQILIHGYVYCTVINPMTKGYNSASFMSAKHFPEEKLIKSSMREKIKLAITETEESSPLKG